MGYYFELAPEKTIGWYEAIMDSEANAVFCILIALWSTIFIETWKKREEALMFEWDLEILRENTTEEIRKSFNFVLKYDSDINETIKTRPRDTTKYERYNWMFIFAIFIFEIIAQVTFQEYGAIQEKNSEIIPDFMLERKL